MKMNLQVMDMLFVTLIAFSKANNPYCEVPTCNNQSHTLCRYTDPSPADSCGTIIRAGLTDIEREIILNLHNGVRERVHTGHEVRGVWGGQPAAVSYVPLEWDYDLEMSAQRWANQCISDKDECRDMHDYLVGQSIEEVDIIEDNIYHIDVPVWAWYEEVNNYFRGNIRLYRSQVSAWDVTNEYTQMVWSRTKRVGCGAIRFSVADEAKLFFVCNYGPRGNIDNQPVYEIL